LDGLEIADKVLIYFDPDTKSPITLLELGLVAHPLDKVIVVCPRGYWKKGNVDIVCERYGLAQAKSLNQAIQWLK